MDVRRKKENNSPHLFLAVLGVVGLGVLVVLMASTVLSAATPTFSGGPDVFGHRIDDLKADGEFYGDTLSQTIFPGNIWVRGYAGIGTAPVLTTMLTVVSGTLNNLGLSVSANNARVADFISTSSINSAQIALKDPVSEWRMGTKIGSAPQGTFSIHKQLNTINAITIATDDKVGINNDNPAQTLDVTGQIHASGDICTDADGGKCLSNLNKDAAIYNGLVQECNPSCIGGSLSMNPVDAKCGVGYVLVACGGGVNAITGTNSVKTSIISPLYAQLGGGLTDGVGNPVDGCRLTWGVSGGSATGMAIAVCAPVGT